MAQENIEDVSNRILESIKPHLDRIEQNNISFREASRQHNDNLNNDNTSIHLKSRSTSFDSIYSTTSSIGMSSSYDSIDSISSTSNVNLIDSLKTDNFLCYSFTEPFSNESRQDFTYTIKIDLLYQLA